MSDDDNEKIRVHVMGNKDYGEGLEPDEFACDATTPWPVNEPLKHITVIFHADVVKLGKSDIGDYVCKTCGQYSGDPDDETEQ